MSDWLNDMHLIEAGGPRVLDRYIGYFEPYATSHDALDQDAAIQQEVSNAAAALARHIHQRRSGLRPRMRALENRARNDQRVLATDIRVLSIAP